MIYTVTLNPSIDYVVHLEQLQVGSLNRIQTEHKFPGGKGINVSRVLQRLACPSTALGFLGGTTGQFITTSLAAEGILTNFTPIQAETRLNVKIKAQEETEVNGAGPLIRQEEIEALKQQLKIVGAHDLVIFSGSLPPSLPRSFYTELIAQIKEQQGEFIIDTTGTALLEALPYKPLLIKPNKHELAELFQQELTSLEQILPYGRELLRQNAQHVLVSLGQAGALMFTQRGCYFAEPLLGQVKNSVGAGDAMIAGFVSHLHQAPEDCLTALRYGVAAGSATAFATDLASQSEILALVPKVSTRKIGD